MIDVRYCDLSEKHFIDIVNNIPEGVDTLIFNGNDFSGFDEETFILFGETLVGNEAVVVLEMASCSLKDEIGEILVYYFKKRAFKLQRFVFDGNYFTKPVFAELSNIAVNDSIIFAKRYNAYMAKSLKSIVTVLKLKSVGSVDDIEDVYPSRITYSDIKVIKEVNVGGGSGASIYEVIVEGWTCAMKQLPISENASLLLKEIEMLNSLPYHPNIVTYLFHEIKYDHIRLYTTLYHCSLRKVIKEKKVHMEKGLGSYFGPLEIARYTLEILTGLKFLHERKIIHRDLKTENIFVMIDLLGDVTEIAIGDFDTARTHSSMNRAKTLTGTTDYMAPEVMTDDTYTATVDIWSFGMIIYEMVTLNRPYCDVPFHKVPSYIKKGKRPPVDPNLIDEYFDLIDLFEQCTEIEPTIRPTLGMLEKFIHAIFDSA